MRLTHWPAAMIEARWSDLAGLFAKALEYTHGEMLMSDLYEFLLNGTYHTAVVDDGDDLVAVCCYRVVNKRRMKILVCELAGGSRLEEWMHLNWDYAEGLKRKLGADRLELVGRPGWARILRKAYPGRVTEKCVTLIIEESSNGRQS